MIRSWLKEDRMKIYLKYFYTFAIPAVLMIFPFYWMVVTSLKPVAEVYKSSLVPLNPTFEHWIYVWRNTRYGQAFLNSVFLSVLSTALTLFIAVPCAYTITRFKSRVLSLFTILILLIYMVPRTLILIPMYLIAYKMGMVNSLSHLSILYLTFTLPFAIWLLRSYLAGIPIALEEAAMVDGCTRFQSLRWIMLPLMAPGMISTAAIVFFMNWGEYLWATVFLRKPEMQTVSVVMSAWFADQSVIFPWPVVMAGAVQSVVLPVTFLLILQRRLVGGLARGAIKG